MNNVEHYIQFDIAKLNSIGFNASTIVELIDKLSEYILSLENEFHRLDEEELQNKNLLKILHKLEGSLQYLALSGPIDYINVIRNSIDLNKKETLVSISNLFVIIHKTIMKLKLFYSN